MQVNISPDLLSYFLLGGVGFIAGFIDTIAGGGGMITLPAYFMAGLPPHIAIGTNKLSGALSVGNAARIFIRKKIFRPRYWISAMVGTFSGGLGGSFLVHFTSSQFLRKLLPFVIIGLAIYVAIPKKYNHLTESQVKPKPLSSSLTGVCLGFYDGFIGPGTGSFWVVALMAIFKINMVEATGIAKLMNFMSNISALTVFALFGTIYYGIGLVMAATMMLGAYFGAHSTIRWGMAFIRPAFLVIVVGIAIVLAIQTWF